MTASFLKRFFGSDLEVTMVEASDIPIIGVGESTNTAMKYFQNALGLDEKSMVRASNAAFKIGIRFANFNRKGSHFFHPFGQPMPAPCAALAAGRALGLRSPAAGLDADRGRFSAHHSVHD
jgi:tryptophan halogenase